MWSIDFISEQNFLDHVKETIVQYGIKLEPYDLRKFNSNIVDPIKMIFDRAVYKFDWNDIVKNEIFRQRDKASNNDIGYFHQKIFQYIESCTVPDEGWDVIFKRDTGIKLPEGDTVHTIYVEMKNKHNTMNSSASARTYINMQRQLLADDDCACFLVEAIARRSQNIPWQLTVDGISGSHRRIRRVSIDEFYSVVTGQDDAFYQICMVLPDIIERAISGTAASIIPKDTVMEELNIMSKEKGESISLALYMLGFGSYKGFS